MPKFLAAAIQLNSQPDLERNMQEIYRLVKRAAEEGAAFIGLPENFAFMGNEKERLKQAKTLSASVESRLPVWAKEFGVTLLGGGYPVPAGEGKVFNRSRLITPDGKTAAVYDKIHLFDVELSAEETYRESDMVEGGRDVVSCFSVALGVRIGLSICYDVRFPELYRKLAEQGSGLLCVPAAFTRPTGKAHWEVLLRARAIENSSFMIAPAQTGKHGDKRETYGHSLIIDPWGTVLADAGTEPGVAIAEIDTSALAEVRRKLPSLSHRIL